MKKTLLLILTMGSVLHCLAQTEETAKERKLTHHVGVQINELIRQVFNFNGASSSNTNPYLLTYSVNSVKSGWGARLGLGYTYRSFTDDNGVSNVVTDVNDLQLRIGAEKAFSLSPKWTAGAGLDFLFNTNSDRTKSTIFSFDTTTTVTKTNIRSLGGGGMGWIRYNISSRIELGTEVSFYYTSGTQKQDITITHKDFGSQQWTTSKTKTDNGVSEGLFRLPIAIYLSIRI